MPFPSASISSRRNEEKVQNISLGEDYCLFLLISALGLWPQTLLTLSSPSFSHSSLLIFCFDEVVCGPFWQWRLLRARAAAMLQSAAVRPGGHVAKVWTRRICQATWCFGVTVLHSVKQGLIFNPPHQELWHPQTRDCKCKELRALWEGKNPPSSCCIEKRADKVKLRDKLQENFYEFKK